MSKTISCAGCGQKFNLTPNLLGKRVKCPKCGNKIDIPLPVAKRLEPVASPSADGELALKALSDLIPEAPPTSANEIPGLVALEPEDAAVAEIPGLVPLAAQPAGDALDGLVPLAAAPANSFAGAASDPFGMPAAGPSPFGTGGFDSPGLGDMGGLAALPAAGMPAQARQRQVEADPPGTMRLIYICGGIAGTAMFILLIVIAVNAYQQANKARLLAEQNAPKPPPAAVATTSPTLTPATTLTPVSSAPVASVLNVPKFPDLGAAIPLPSGILTYTVDITNFSGNNATAPGMAMRMRVYLPPGDHQPKSLPCVLIAPAGTNLMRGNDIASLDYTAETVPYAQAGMAVVHYSLDGIVPENTPPDDLSQLKAFVAAYPKFKAAQAGILNGQHALEFVLARLPQVNPDKIYSAGHSSAGTVSLLLAEHEPRIKACISYAGTTDMSKGEAGAIIKDPNSEKVLPGIGEFFKQYSPVTHAAKLRCPVFLFHAKDDSITPISESTDFAKLLEAAGNKPTYVEVATGNHYDSMINEGIPQAINWLKNLPPPTTPMPVSPLPMNPAVVNPTPMNPTPMNPANVNPMPVTPSNPTPMPGLNEIPGTVPPTTTPMVSP